MGRLRPAQKASQAPPMAMHEPQPTGGRPKAPATERRRCRTAASAWPTGEVRSVGSGNK